MLAGGPVGYKASLHPTVALSTTEAEFMQAAVFGRMMLYCRSVMWDLDIPQYAANIGYEDTEACTMMAMAQKPTPRTQHIDIKHQALCQWVEQDLVKLEKVDTTRNMADIYTKQLGQLLFRRHCDYLMGRVPPSYSVIHETLRERCRPTRLSRERDDHGKGNAGTGLPFYAAAAARVSAGDVGDVWSIVTEHWRRQ